MTQKAFTIGFWIATCLLGPCFVSGAPIDNGPAKPAAGFQVIGYLPEYRMAELNPEVLRGLTDLVYFSVTPQATGDAGLEVITAEHLTRLRQWQAKYGFRLRLCIGGWGRSDGFKTLVADASKRRKFVEQVATFCDRHGFAGIDVDWEHPETPEEHAGYARLLVEIRDAIRPRGGQLSIAVAGWQTLAPESIAAVDAVHVMAYDAQGKHATFEGAQADVRRLIERGVPREKIVLGLPFYGRVVERPDDAVSYAEIQRRHATAADIDEVAGIYFNGPAMIGRKTEWAAGERFRGVMIWEMGHELAGDNGLLPAILRHVPK